MNFVFFNHHVVVFLFLVILSFAMQQPNSFDNNNNNNGSNNGSNNKRTIIHHSEAYNQCGMRNYLVYIPAFKLRDDKTIANVIPHWTFGLSSFFIMPREITYEWLSTVVAECNDNKMEDCNDNPIMMHVYRDGDSFIRNVLAPNVEQVCKNICIPRGNVDGSLIEMLMAGANMSISDGVLRHWQTLVRETIRQEQEKQEDPICDCEMCEFYRDDSYSRSTSTTDCSGDPICNSDDSDW